MACTLDKTSFHDALADCTDAMLVLSPTVFSQMLLQQIQFAFITKDILMSIKF